MDTELRKACQRLHDHEQAAQNFQRSKPVIKYNPKDVCLFLIKFKAGHL